MPSTCQRRCTISRQFREITKQFWPPPPHLSKSPVAFPGESRLSSRASVFPAFEIIPRPRRNWSSLTVDSKTFERTNERAGRSRGSSPQYPQLPAGTIYDPRSSSPFATTLSPLGRLPSLSPFDFPPAHTTVRLLFFCRRLTIFVMKVHQTERALWSVPRAISAGCCAAATATAGATDRRLLMREHRIERELG